MIFYAKRVENHEFHFFKIFASYDFKVYLNAAKLIKFAHLKILSMRLKPALSAKARFSASV